MESSRRIDSPLSHSLARPTLILAVLALVIGAVVGRAVPPLAAWTFAHWLVLAAVLIDCVVVSRRSGPLPWPHEVLMVGVTGAAALLVVLSAPAGGTGFELGLLCVGVALLILRGNIVVGTVAALVLLGLQAGTGAAVTCAAAQPLGCAAASFVPVAVMWGLFLIWRAIAVNRAPVLAEQLTTVVRTDAVHGRLAHHQWIRHEVPAVVEPILRRLVEGENLTPELHGEVRAADSHVRALLRRDVPTHRELLRAIGDAQRRGVAVKVVGAEEEASGVISDALAAHLIALLEDERVTDATIRFVPQRRGGTVSILLDAGGDVRRREFAPDGTPIGDL